VKSIVDQITIYPLQIYMLPALDLQEEIENLKQNTAAFGEIHVWSILDRAIDQKPFLLLESLLKDILAGSGLFLLQDFLTLCFSLSAIEQKHLEQLLLRVYFALEQKPETRIVFLETQDLDPRLLPFIPRCYLNLPTAIEVEPLLSSLLPKSWIDNRVLNLTMGLSFAEICLGLKVALNSSEDNYDLFLSALFAYRRDKLGLLGLQDLPLPTTDIGGLENLRASLPDITFGFSAEARRLRLPYPRGWLLVGPPGTGKTHSAKVIAKTLGYQLISVGIDTVCAGGAAFFKNLLVRIESCAPCVAYFDELDKFFGSLEAKQILGVLLTWLQEKRSSVFVIATLNRLDELPPELTRSGRFDRLFYVDFPNEGERYEILKLHLSRYQPAFREVLVWSENSWRQIITATATYTGAELEYVVNHAASLVSREIVSIEVETSLPEAKVATRTTIDFQAEDLLKTVRSITSLYKRNPNAMLDIQNRAKRFAEPASAEDASIFSRKPVNVFSVM
jgi:ATP-dependent 26S proteasome regulatory subunit